VSQFVLDNLVAAGLSDVVFVINQNKAQLLGYFGNGRRFGCNIAYAVQETPDHRGQSTSPGLAHALDSAYHVVKDRPVFFGMADTIMEPRDVFARAWADMRPNDDVMLVLFPTNRPEKFGMVKTAQDGTVLEVVDKPRQTGLTHMWGCIIWRPRFTRFLHECVHESGIADFAAVLNSAIRNGMHVRSHAVEGGDFSDLGTYEEIRELDAKLRER
jgi:dTDP-glucose pyrophosphorylase